MLSLEDIREQIDETDKAILELLAQRSRLVSSVAEAKAQSGDSRILRPAREIVQMRRFLTWFKECELDMPVSGFRLFGAKLLQPRLVSRHLCKSCICLRRSRLRVKDLVMPQNIS